MSEKLIAACIQTNASPDLNLNLERVEPMLEAARSKGAQLIALPENVSCLATNRAHLFSCAPAETDHPAIKFFSAKAKAMEAWILVGSIPVSTGHDRLANRSYLFNPTGEAVAHYDKIHMFDAQLSEQESYRESANYKGGNRAVVAQTPWGKLGMTICYDLRFPHLHRALAKAGAKIIAVPAAFAYTTGKMHWHVLLRARAIETGCYIIAPGQCGIHEGGRRTYGHSLIVAPSGEIIAEAGEEKPDVIVAELDLAKVTDARRRLPSLQHDCVFEQPVG
jgi:deaminated glutathione amidase